MLVSDRFRPPMTVRGHALQYFSRCLWLPRRKKMPLQGAQGGKQGRGSLMPDGARSRAGCCCSWKLGLGGQGAACVH